MEVENCTEEEGRQNAGGDELPVEDLETYNMLSDEVEKFWEAPDGRMYVPIIQKIADFLIKKDHPWCKYPNIAPEVFIIFTEDNLRNVDSVKYIISQLTAHLNTCTKCVDKFHYGKRVFQERVMNLFPEEFKHIINVVTVYNINRIEEYFSSCFRDATNPNFIEMVKVPVYETLKYPEVFAFERPNLVGKEESIKSIEDYILEVVCNKNVIKSEVMINMWKTEFLPGLFYYLLFHPTSKAIPMFKIIIENYVTMNGKRKLNNTEYDILKPIITQATDFMNNDDFRVLASRRNISENGVKVQTWNLFYGFISVNK